MPTAAQLSKRQQDNARLLGKRDATEKVWHRNHDKRQIVWGNFRKAEGMLNDVSADDAERIVALLLDELYAAKRKNEINSHK